MLHILIGGAGCGKSTCLIQHLQKQLEAGEQILTLVPEQFSYEFDQKLYRILGPVAFNQLETHSFKSLARAVFQRFGCVPDGKTNADELTKMALLYQAVLQVSEREKKLQLLGKQCRQASFISELAMMFTQFRRSGIPPEQLYNSSAELNGRLQEKMLDVFEIYQRYDQLLEQHQLKDTETDLSEAAAIANGHDAFLGDVIFLDEFESFTEDEYQMLSVLLSSGKDLYIALRMEHTRKEPFSLFAAVQETFCKIQDMAKKLRIPVETEVCDTPYRFQAAELSWLNQHVFRNTQPFSGEAPHLHILEAQSPTEEVDYVCATIRRLLAKDHTLRCRDIAVLSNQMTDYRSILETAMERYKLPYYMDEKESMLYTPLLVYLHTLLGILRQTRPDTELLMRLGKTGLTSCSVEEISDLENYCYMWQIDGKTWNTPFTAGNFASAEAVRLKLLTPLQELREKLKGQHTGAEFCSMLYQFLTEQQVEEQLNRQLKVIADEQKRMQTSEEWALVWNSFIDILEHLSTLYRTLEMEFSEFSTVFAALTGNIQRATPPRTLDAVLISQGSTARLNAPKIVFLLGVCEGTFPAFPGGSMVFSERDCEFLPEDVRLSVAKPAESQMADARLAAYKLLSSASHALYLTYPVVDVTHQKCYPSAVIAQIQRTFPEAETLHQNCASLEPSYYSVTMHAAYYQYVQNYAAHNTDTASIEQLLLDDASFAEKLKRLGKLAEQRSEDAPLFSISSPELMQQYLGNTMQLSASSLERYQKCPFRYYCNDILRLYQRQKVQMNAANYGSMVHYCLEQLLRKYDKKSFLALTAEQLQQEIQTSAAVYWQENMGGDFSKSEREQAAYHHAVEEVLPVCQHLQEEFRQSAFVPYCTELQISSENPNFPPICLHTEAGQTVKLIGKIDRVDICQDGDQQWVRVVDYKTNGKIFELGNLLYGLDMQMLIYLFSILSEGTALAGSKPAGVLYLPAGKVKCNLKREDAVSPAAKRNQSYQMNGVLLQDAHLLRLMEKNGDGVYLNGKLNATGGLELNKGIFLTTGQMKGLRQYVLDQLIYMAERVYRGEIDALPLDMGSKTVCEYCDFSNICGTSSLCRKRLRLGSATVQKSEMMRILEELAEEEKH